MSDLRAKLIEAGARALYWPYDWDAAGVSDVEVFLARSEAALDAFLDCLAENADETIHPRYNDEPNPWRLGDAAVEDLLVVLREPDDE